VYREARSTLAHVLEAKLSPHRFKTVEPTGELSERGVKKLLHRKTWSTNSGVVLAEPGVVALRDYIACIRREAGPFLGSSRWNPLGLQVVLVMTDAAPVPPLHALEACVDGLDTHGIVIQSVFALDPSARQWTAGRTWQFVTGKFQDAIAAAIKESLSRD
jgi:hypothetical protein